MLKNYLTIAWRNLFKNKSTSFINIAGLAIGMAVAMMIGLWMHDELSYNTYHKNYDRLAQAWIHQTFNGQTGSGPAIALPLAEALRTDFAADFQHIALGSWNYEHLLVYGEQKVLRDGMYAELDLPRMLSLDLVAGSYEEALKNPASILLSEATAQALFGDDDPMGKTVRLDQRSDVQVTGVFKDPPYNSSFHEVKFYLPWSLYLTHQEWVKEAQQQWGNHSFQLFTQLSEQADLSAVSAKMRDLEKPHFPEGDPALFLHPMENWHLYGEFREGKNVGGRIQFVWLFGIIGVFVLLLACINFMNLSTARSERRAKEVGIRKTVGSRRGHLIGQFLSESLLVVSLALVLSLTLVLLFLPGFNELADKEIRFPWAQPVFWLLVVGFTLLTGLMAGSYPAFYLSSFKPIKVLKGTFRAGRWSAVPRQVLVVLQFTVSVALIIGTIVVFNQIQHAKNRPVGYEREGLIQLNTGTELEGKYDILRNDLLQTGAVYEMSQSSSPTTGVYSNQIGFDWEGKDPNSLPIFGIVACSHDFGKSIGWQIKEGRDFSREFSTDTSALILNEAGVALTGLDNIVGKTITWNEKDYQVIGVVEDLIMESPYSPIKPTVFFIDYDWANSINIKLEAGVPVNDALKRVEGVFKTHAPASPFEFRFVDDEYNDKFRSEVRIGKLARIFAVLAVIISCLGLFGLSAYVAEQRTKELGIRKVLGATVAQLWALQSRGFALLVLVSCLLAAPLAWYFLSGWLATYEYRTELTAGIFLAAGILAVAITLLTVSFQSIKAALSNPVKSLRSE